MWEDEGGNDGWIDCVSLCRMHHSTLTFFALINVITGCGSSFRKTVLLRVFHILHKSATTLSNGIRVVEALILDNQRGTLSDEIGDIV